MNTSKTTSITTGIIGLLLLLALGAFLINLYISKERERDLQHWESRLGLVADTKASAIDQWTTLQFSSLQELADNASLQLYLSQLSLNADFETGDTERARLGYLRNLILAAADRYGYASQEIPRIHANLPQHQATGLALLDTNNRVVVATPGMPEIGKAYQHAAGLALKSGQPQISELRLDGQDRAVLSFAVPVTAVLGTDTGTEGKLTGVLLGVRNADLELFPLLMAGASFAEDNEALLVALKNDSVFYLSPTRDGTRATRRSLPADRANLASALALKMHGEFAIYSNYEGTPVLSAGRRLQSLPWMLVQQVNAEQALSESNEHRRFLLTALSLLLLSIAALAIAAWRHGSSVRAQQQARELRDKALKLQKQTELLHAITDNIDAHTLLLDNRHEVLFANQATAVSAGAKIPELVGKSLAAVLGPVTNKALENDIDDAFARGSHSSRILQLQLDEHDGTYQASYIPVERIGQHRNLMLVVLNNITQLQSVQNKHAELLRNLVSTLVHIVDLHDPYSAHHSSRMAEVANAIGRELQLNDDEKQTLDLAATLANLGKILIPKEVLTKTDPLTQAEQDLLHNHVQYGLELLENLNFEGPVLDTISQKQEHIDGSGYPQGLNNEQMSLTGKILSTANTFVALVSPRAYRKGISIREALDQLMKDAGSKYDRQVIAALFHAAENREDWSQWKSN